VIISAIILTKSPYWLRDYISGVKRRKKIYKTQGNRVTSEMALAQGLTQTRFVVLQICIFFFLFQRGKEQQQLTLP